MLGTGNIVFLVLAAAGPMAATVSFVPLSIGLGSGIGAPGAYLAAGIVLGLFAVGYVAMSRHVTNAGAFYAYATRGLGKPIGFATAMIALVAYNAVVVAVVGFFGAFAQGAAAELVDVNWSWQVWSVIGFATVAGLSFFEIQLSARLLGVALILEVLVLLVMDVAILLDRGASAFTLDSFSPGTVFAGASGISLMYAFASYIGFEATAIYGEEAREPRRTVPRATYLALAIIASFYALTSWALVAGFGADGVVKAAAGDPAGFVFVANAQYVGGFTNDLMQILICTSMFAVLLAFHNASARYIFALSRDGLLPRPLARTHPRHGSPYLASAVQLTVTAIAVVACAVGGLDPLLGIGAAFAGLGTLAIIVLQGIASFSVVGYFSRRPDRHVVKTIVAPLLGGLGLAAAAIQVVHNYSSLTGVTSTVINHLWWVLPAVALLGFALAAYTRSARPGVYGRFGEANADDESAGGSGGVPGFDPVEEQLGVALPLAADAVGE